MIRNQRMNLFTRAVPRPCGMMAIILTAALLFSNFGYLTSVLAKNSQRELSVTTSFAEGKNVSSADDIEIQLSRALEKSEGRIGILIGSSDLTSLFTQIDKKFRYNAKILPLPLGESTLTVYLIAPSQEWKEIARFSINVTNEQVSPKASNDESKTENAPVAPAQKTGQELEQKTEDNVANSDKPSEQRPNSKPDNTQKSAEQKPETSEKKNEPEGKKDIETKPPESGEPTKAKTEEGNKEPSPENKPEHAEEAAQPQGSSAAQEQTKPPAKRFGFEKLNFIPAITLTIKSQPAQSNFPATNQPERATFTDLNMTGSFKTELARGNFNAQTQFDFAGSSFKKEALRFGELGNNALNVDLASYLTQYQFGKAKYLVGHTSYGANRLLLNSFSSRGMTLIVPMSTRFDVSIAAMNGSAIVGFDNFFGLAQRRHQLLGGTVGIEVFRKRPGGLRIEAAAMEAWLLPVSGFNQGVVNDAERSKGIGLRVIATDPSQRFRFEGGFSRSQFVNPADAALNQGQRVVEVNPLWKNAQFLDAAYDIFKGLSITKDKKLNLTFNFKHERVDPLYKSLGASTQADKITNEFLVNGSLGEITAQYAHQRFNDNLANIPSILKSNTRVNTLALGIPLASLFGSPAAQPSPLFPKISYSLNRTYQFGVSVPVNGGLEIDPATVPNQVSTNQGVTADWQFKKWRLAYRANHSFQDNRQKGNETSDLSNLTNGITIGLNPSPVVDVSFDFNAESAFDKRQNTINRNFTFAPNVTWRVNKKMNLVSNVSFNIAGDVAGTRNDHNVNFDLQYSYQFALEKDRWRKVGGQFSIKYTNRFARSQNILAGVNDLKKNQTLFAQVSFTFF